jgi:hypothetical protein
LVAETDEAGDQNVAIDFLADGDSFGGAAEERAGRDTKRKGGSRCDDDRGRIDRIAEGRLVKAMQHFHPLTNKEGLGRESIEGKGVVARIRPDSRLFLALSKQAAKRNHRRVRCP